MFVRALRAGAKEKASSVVIKQGINFFFATMKNPSHMGTICARKRGAMGLSLRCRLCQKMP